MNKVKYLLRLDDACPTMNRFIWERIELLLDHYNVKPIVAVIPNNRDPMMEIDSADPTFWNKVANWSKKGWEVALHGYDHVYITKDKGIIGPNSFSEFAGVPIDIQNEKIRKGLEIFRKHEISTRIWVAPGHTFDENTLACLRLESDIRIISDGYAFNIFTSNGFTWIPQQIGSVVAMPIGLWTICLHPNTMDEKGFQTLKVFIEKYRYRFTDVDSCLAMNNRGVSFNDKLLSLFIRKCRDIKRIIHRFA